MCVWECVWGGGGGSGGGSGSGVGACGEDKRKEKRSSYKLLELECDFLQ